MEKRAKSIPTSRLRRTAKLGGLVGSQGARLYATKAANLTRDEEGRRAAAERRQLKAAEHILDVLGTMKGAAMKVGQVASFVDTGTLPPEFHDRLEAKLAELRDSAPRVSFEDMRKVVERELEAPLEEVFEEFDEQAFAAASIGQVYRARLPGGRRVAVKVQYPGIAQAVRADLQNMGLIMRAAKLFAPAMDAQAMAAEIRERLIEELDYQLEAETHRRFARTWRGHPFVFVPDVVTSLSSERVLATDFVDGRSFDEVKQLPQGGARPLRRDPVPVLLLVAVPDPPFLGLPPSRELHPDGGRPRCVPGLRYGEEAVARARRSRGARSESRDRGGLPRPCGRRWRHGILRSGDTMVTPERARALRRRLRLVPRGPRLHDRPRLRAPGLHRRERPALAVLRDHEAPDRAARRDVRPPHGGADARSPGPARGDRELAPHRPRVAFGDPPATPLGEAEAEFFAEPSLA